jgi:hypothetical protein
MYQQFNTHKLYGRLSELRLLFLLTLFSEGSIEADLMLSSTWFESLISVQRESLQKVFSSVQSDPNPHRHASTVTHS